MTTFLVVIVVVLLAIAVWQLTKIFDISQAGSQNTPKSLVADDRDNKINGYLMFAFLGFIYLTTILSMVYCGKFPLLSNSASEHGPEYDNLMIITLVLIFIVQTITQEMGRESSRERA
jgi:cytochrome c oxidase subunit 2